MKKKVPDFEISDIILQLKGNFDNHKEYNLFFF